MTSLFREYIGKDWAGASPNAKSPARGFDHRVLTYKQFQNFCRDPLVKGKGLKQWGEDMGLPKGRPSDRLKKTVVVIDEAHNLYNTSDLSQDEIHMDKNIRSELVRLAESIILGVATFLVLIMIIIITMPNLIADSALRFLGY